MEFVTFEIAKKLKEEGFPQHWSDQHYVLENEYDDYFEVGAKYPVDVIYDYISTIAAPTISQVLKWLREEKNIHIGFGYSPHKKWRYVVMYIDDRFYDKPTLSVNGFIKIKDAALAGIEYVLDNLI